MLLLGLCACGAAAPAATAPPATVDVPPRARGSMAAGVPSLVARGADPRSTVGIAFEDLGLSRELITPDNAEDVSDGMAIFDADGDGDLDVLVPSATGLQLFRNDGGFTFTEVPGAESGLSLEGQASSAALGDCDGDGDLDVFVAVRKGSRLFKNEGGGRFSDFTVPGGIEPRPVSYGQSLFFDADGDGDLDLFVACYTAGTGPDGRTSGCQDELWVNDGACHFHEEAVARGMTDMGFGLAVATFDPDGDGAPDIVVSNDYGLSEEPSHVWHNDGTGHFSDVSEAWNLPVAQYAMTASIYDLDGDGLLDLYVGNICENRLYLGGPGPIFRDATYDLGVDGGWISDGDRAPISLPPLDPTVPRDRPKLLFRQRFMSHRPDDPHAACSTSWSSPMPDLDADGQRELFVVNGGVGEDIEADAQPDMLFRRKGFSGPFTEIGEDAGVADPLNGRVGIFADLDADGRLDLLVGDLLRQGQPNPGIHVLRNVTRAENMGHYLRIDLRGSGANTWAVGSLVEVKSGGRTQVAYRSLGETFLGSNASPLYFGLGAATSADEVVVHWPWGGGEKHLTSVPAGTLLVTQGR